MNDSYNIVNSLQCRNNYNCRKVYGTGPKKKCFIASAPVHFPYIEGNVTLFVFGNVEDDAHLEGVRDPGGHDLKLFLSLRMVEIKLECLFEVSFLKLVINAKA